MTLELRFDDEEQAAFVALGLGSRVEVMAPARLRQRVAAEHAAALRRAPMGD